MIDLIAKSACDGLLPLSLGRLSLSEAATGHITALMPRKGQAKAASEALKAAHGMGFPAPGRSAGRAGNRALWFGLDQALLIGPAPDKSLHKTCALSNQSDGWAVMVLSGAQARDVLARLCPLDLRDASFKRGHAGRSLLGHISVSIMRSGADNWQIMLPRSMAASAVHELGAAMKSVVAQPR